MLTARDWTDLGVKGTTRRYDVATIAARAIELPDRFRLTTMARDPDFASKLRLHHDAWGHDAPVTALDLDLFRYSRTAPTYDARLDISILAPDGEHVAGCIVFPDYANGDGEIERVCTHSAYRRRGLAMAAILGAFRAADAVGLKTATLTGYGEDAVRMYGRFEAVDTWTWHGWRTVVRLPPATTT
jgi:GNAT superfamily N-acetyltransferase